tara:strand:- start:1232 stop:2473 length:1242 start_codon:yes stop_codon:yes gene_type:complete
MTTGRHNSYEEYISFQKTKTEDPVRREKWLNEEWDLKLKGFEELFIQHGLNKGNKKALCIGARTGQEVVALKNLGIDAQGIDIVPCLPHVIKGDMHNLQFDDEEFDFVFSNVYDHSLYPEKKASEIERVLKVGGKVLFQLQIDIEQDEYTEFYIHRTDHDILPLFHQSLCIKNESIPRNVFGMNWEIVLQKNEFLAKTYDKIGKIKELTVPQNYKQIWDDINLSIQIQKTKNYKLTDDDAKDCLDILPKRGFYLTSLAEAAECKKIVEMGTAEGWQFYTFAESVGKKGGHVWSADIRDVRNKRYIEKYKNETTFVNGTSKELASFLRDNKIQDIDMFYIDASHDKGAVIADIINLKEFQSHNPIWVLDDYDKRFGCFYDIERICKMKKNYRVHNVGKTASGNPTHQVVIFGRM